MANSPYTRRYHAIKNSLTAAEKELISIYEIHWFMRRTVPTVEEVHDTLKRKFPKIKQTSVNYYLQRQPVISALKKRGIPWEQHSREDLTDQQKAAALVIANFADKRSNAEKLDSLGINPAAYYAWLKDPLFQSFVQTLADENLEHIDPVVKTELAKKIQDGDWNAMKFYMESVGTLNNKDMPQSEHLIMMLIEIIQRHVKDPQIIAAIALDIKNVSQNRTLAVTQSQPALEGALVENPIKDEELMRAEKMLGFG